MIRKTGLAEQGLFSRLQSYFASSFGGRYVEHILKETIEERPRLAKRLFGVRDVGPVKVEHRFKINGATRIADLAFVSANTEKPCCMVEIKYDDHKNPSNAAQLEDYLTYVDRAGNDFVYLSQHLPPAHIRETLRERDGRLVLFSDLADRLEHSEDSVEGLLRRFFVDKGLVMHKFTNAEYGHLRSFMFRLFNPWGGAGRTHTKEGMSGAVADVFGDLLRNVNIICREVMADVVDRKREPTIDFWAEPFVSAAKIKRKAEAARAAAITTEGSRAGGFLWVYGRSSFTNSRRHWMNIEFGVCLEVVPGDRNVYPHTFAQVNSSLLGGDEGAYSEKAAGKRILCDKVRAVAAVKQRLREAIKEAAKHSLPRSFSSSLSKLLEVL